MSRLTIVVGYLARISTSESNLNDLRAFATPCSNILKIQYHIHPFRMLELIADDRQAQIQALGNKFEGRRHQSFVCF